MVTKVYLALSSGVINILRKTSDMSYVAPVTMYLGFDKNGTKRYFEYVPIIETIQQLLKDPAVKKQFKNPVNRIQVPKLL